MVQHGLDCGLEVGPVYLVDLSGNTDGHLGSNSRLDGAIQPLLRRSTPEKRQILSRTALERIEVVGKAVIDRGAPRPHRQRPPLSVRNGDQRHVWKLPIDGGELGQIEPSV